MCFSSHYELVFCSWCDERICTKILNFETYGKIGKFEKDFSHTLNEKLKNHFFLKFVDFPKTFFFPKKALKNFEK